MAVMVATAAIAPQFMQGVAEEDMVAEGVAVTYMAMGVALRYSTMLAEEVKPK